MLPRQVSPTINLLLVFVNLFVDVTTEAIYRAYDDGADISECLRLMFCIEQIVVE